MNTEGAIYLNRLMLTCLEPFRKSQKAKPKENEKIEPTLSNLSERNILTKQGTLIYAHMHQKLYKDICSF